MTMSKISDQILTAAIVRVVVGGVRVYFVLPCVITLHKIYKMGKPQSEEP